MPGSIVTQSACILFERAPALDEVRRALAGFVVAKAHEAAEEWPLGGPGLLVAFRPEVNGYLDVDVVDHPWPDDMGSPEGDQTLFGAWTMGLFGPCVYPGNLERAVQQCWGWEGGGAVAGRHRAFARVRATYAAGAGPDDLVLPPDYEAIPELVRVTEVAAALLDLPGALAFFNPNGEALRSPDEVAAALEGWRAAETLPISLWCNVRLFSLADSGGWVAMDTVGLGQLDLPDQEACFPGEAYDPDRAADFLYGVANYLVENGPVITEGNTASGPGAVSWRAHHMEESLTDPPRAVMRWFPEDGSEPPERLLPTRRLRRRQQRSHRAPRRRL